MSVLTSPLFTSSRPPSVGVGYNNVASGCYGASHPNVINKIEDRYGQRCGHLPLDAKLIYVLVANPTTEIETQWAYLSQLIGKTVTVLSPQDLVAILHKATDPNALVVPYINVPETEHWIPQQL